MTEGLRGGAFLTGSPAPGAQATASVGQHAVISVSGKPVSVKAKEIDKVDAKTGNPEITISIAFSLGIIDARQLNQYLVVAQAVLLDDRLIDAQNINTVANRLNGLIHRVLLERRGDPMAARDRSRLPRHL